MGQRSVAVVIISSGFILSIVRQGSKSLQVLRCAVIEAFCQLFQRLTMQGYFPPIPERKLAGLLNHLAKEDSFVFLETTRVNEENYLSYLFLEPIDRIICKATDDPAVFMASAQRYLEQGYYLAGCLSYELGHILEESLAGLVRADDQIVADLGVFRQPFVYDHRCDDFIGSPPWQDWPANDDNSTDGYRVSDLTLSQNKEEYLDKIASIKSYIEAGDTYQVNYTLKLHFNYLGSDAAFYQALRRNQSVSYGAFIKNDGRRILSFSPELFFRKKGNDCLVRPMKGTMGRKPSLDEDLLVRSSLSSDIKNCSENIMIVDLLRNDLGKLSVMGKIDTVSLFDVETYETLHQMTSCLRGELKPEVTLLELFRAIFPCGSVTGAPKIRTMEIIHELEAEERGVYTGAIGFIGPQAEAIFNVPIRTVVLENGRGEMGIGSGIVYDSDPENEWEECLLKGKFLQETLPEFKLIESILYVPAQGFWLLDHHLRRLHQSATYWGFAYSEELITDSLHRVVAVTESKDSYMVRLLLHKDGSQEVEAVKLPKTTGLLGEQIKDELPLVCLSAVPIDSTDPFFYHKTTCRTLYDAERKAAVAAGFFEVLFGNERQEVTEGTITNVFVRKAGKLLTPPLHCGLLAGVLRAALLAGEVAAPDGLEVVEEVIGLDDLRKAEAIYLGNSVRGLIRVKLAGGQTPLPLVFPGPTTC